MDTSSVNNVTMTNEVDLTIEGSVGGPYMVEKIVGIYYGKNRQKYYRVKWLDSWEPAENLSEGCQGLIDEFWSGTNQDNYGKPISQDNLEIGQKLIKTEEDLYPVAPPVSSSTEPRSSVSSTNDNKVDVSSTNDGTNNVSSTNKKRNTRNANQNKNPQQNSQNRNPQTGNQNRNPQTAKQTRNPQAAKQTRNPQTAKQTRNLQTANQTRNPPTANQTRNPQTANQTRRSQTANQKRNNQKSNQNDQSVNQNIHSSPNRNAVKRPMPPTPQNVDYNTRNNNNNLANNNVNRTFPGNQKGNVSSTINNNILSNQNINISADQDDPALNDQKTAIAQVTVQAILQETSPIKNPVSSLQPASDNNTQSTLSNSNSIPSSCIKKPMPSPPNKNTVSSPPNRNVVTSPIPNRNAVTSPIPNRNAVTSPIPNRNAAPPPVSNRNTVASPTPNTNTSGVRKIEISLPDQKSTITSPTIEKEATLSGATTIPDDGRRESKLEIQNESMALNSLHDMNKKVSAPIIEQKGTLPDTTILPDDGVKESKLEIQNKSIVSTSLHNINTEVTAPTTQNMQTFPDTTIIPDDGERESKLEIQNESIVSNSTLCNINIVPPSSSLHDISTVPIKMASPTSVVPVEATSTIEDDIQDSYYDRDSDTLIDSQDNIKNAQFGNDMEGNVCLNNFENLEGNEEGNNYVLDNEDGNQYVNMVENDEEQENFGNYNNDMNSNIDMINEEPIDEEQNNYINEAGNDFLNEGYNSSQNNFVNEGYNISRNNFPNEGYSASQNNFANEGYNANENFSNEVYNNCVNIREDNDEQSNWGGMENYDPEIYVDDGSLYSEYDSQPEDVIELDLDDNEDDADDVELIVSIDSPQKRRQGRLPASLQPSVKADGTNKTRKRGRPVNQRGRRGRLPNVKAQMINNNNNSNNTVTNVPPLVHPRLLLHSPQTLTEDPTTPSPQRQRSGSKRGASNSRRSNNVSNAESSPTQRINQQHSIVNSPTPTFVTPPRKRQRSMTQPTMISDIAAPNTPRSAQVTPQNKNRRIFQTENPQQNLENTPSSDFSPSRTVLNDRTCTICSHTFANLTLARQHAKQVHANQYGSPVSSTPSLVCQVCKAMFKTNKDLKSHMLLHSNHTLHKCEICFRAFKQRSVLNQHMLIHSEELPYACSICDKRFRQQGHLIGHLGSTHSENNEGTYTCPHCSIDFNDEDSFKEHMREHDAELPFKCNFCQLRFEMKSNLMLHLEGHNEGRQFTCHICKKSFKTKSYYLGHMQMHKIRDEGGSTSIAAPQGSDFDGNNVGDAGFADVKNR